MKEIAITNANDAELRQLTKLASDIKELRDESNQLNNIARETISRVSNLEDKVAYIKLDIDAIREDVVWK